MARTKKLITLSRTLAGGYALGLMLFAAQAQAGSLTNLDTKPYTFDISIGGETQKVTLAAGETYRSHAGVEMKVHADNGMLRIRPEEEYSIWKGGKILLQGRSARERRQR